MNGRAGMRCPHLTKDVIYVCESGQVPEVLKTPRLRKLCKCAGFHTCPVYITSKRHVGLYYQLEPAA